MGRRHTLITCCTIAWLLLFFYQTFRLNYLGPWLGRELPRLRLLFPPAGWIMFYRVGRAHGSAEVYAVADDRLTPIDPHEIFSTRALGYDNFHRNVLLDVLYADRRAAFCRYLQWKLPRHRQFLVAYVHRPDVIEAPDDVRRQPVYACP